MEVWMLSGCNLFTLGALAGLEEVRCGGFPGILKPSTLIWILPMSTTKTQQRVSFSTVKNRVPYPDLLEVQLKSFRDFFQMDTTAENRKNEGLYKVFQENFPITDTRNNFVLEFIDYYIDLPRYSIEECLERGLTYSVPLKAKLKLYCTDDEHEDFGVVVQDVYFGTIPI